MRRTYRELIRLPTFEERFEYLRLNGVVAKATFGFDRYINQLLYKSREWKHFRNDIIIRDESCDLGIPGREILIRPIVHHINPITVEDVENHNPIVFDPNNVILVTHDTHNAIHYGDESILAPLPISRSKGDTCPWKVY
jgi:hypothetical protein